MKLKKLKFNGLDDLNKYLADNKLTKKDIMAIDYRIVHSNPIERGEDGKMYMTLRDDEIYTVLVVDKKED
jgi:CRISPR/Cas system CSM-associated protein Csm4 (group 5 of RAMP superfamily)